MHCKFVSLALVFGLALVSPAIAKVAAPAPGAAPVAPVQKSGEADPDDIVLPQAPSVQQQQLVNMVLPELPKAPKVEEEPPKPQGCALDGQVRLCVNHSTMQRETCAADDLDCQCTWAQKLTQCYAPCMSDKVNSDNMHAAKADQDGICQQAAKNGKIAKDKERLKKEQKNGKSKKQTQNIQQKNINDLASSHDLSTQAADEESTKQKPAKEDKAPDSSDSAPRQEGGNKSNNSGGKDPELNNDKSGKNGKAKPGGDSNLPLMENAAGNMSAFSSVLLIPLALAFRSVF
ncbi:hypothetical protein DL89DRAFT_292245 [Linderina pennispora]|uniref:Extracellular membrane protein CFEM domain-containing protein n=1 Tax=Linderina pennispora TaxID=61395 RepID=A0A1Y1WBH6_9FUNG|nr:uncharacterized protein DL89DRAFT_292245 [Linderina pennispora]ORX70596.1 hypothetical protein DL89DRAFT_292245 [Linderina pennispora]